MAAYTSVAAFAADYAHEAQGTSKLIGALTDASLLQRVSHDDERNIGTMSMHLAATIGYLGSAMGLKVDAPAFGAGQPSVPAKASEVAAIYDKASNSLVKVASETWKDSDLGKMVSVFGQEMPIGVVLDIAVKHEIHHRGQIMVLMHQAGGMHVAGVYGPSRHDAAKK